MSARAADDFVAIRTRMVELRQKPAEVRAREAVRHGAAKEHYPQQLMGAVTRRLHALALREARALNFCNLESILHYASLTVADKPRGSLDQFKCALGSILLSLRRQQLGSCSPLLAATCFKDCHSVALTGACLCRRMRHAVS